MGECHFALQFESKTIMVEKKRLQEWEAVGHRVNNKEAEEWVLLPRGFSLFLYSSWDATIHS